MRKNKDKINNNTKMKLWEHIFIISNIVIILSIIGIYTYRGIFYYKKLNVIEEDATLLTVLTNKNNITYNKDGLYKKDDTNYYYSGISVNNYLSYNGIIWRIVSINEKGIKLITEENQTVLVWGINTNYENSIINKWLQNKFLNIIENKDNLVKEEYCNTNVDINNYECNEKIESLVGLITTDEYLKSGGINSYLNNKTYFWTLNTNEESRAYYIHNEGGINNQIGSNNSLYSYGVRPVITIKSNIKYLSGDGTKDNPYLIENKSVTKINETYVGEYIKYNDYIFRVIEKKNEYIKLLLDGVLEDNDNKVKLTYDKVEEYLNNSFINQFNTNSLVDSPFYQTEYKYENNYNYEDIKNTSNKKVGLPLLGDLYITSYPDTWLNTIQNKLVYKSTTDSIMADLTSSENYIRPIISIRSDLKIVSGIGTKENPYLLEETE